MTSKALLSTAYMAPVSYYREMAARGSVVIEAHEHYVKQTYRNRCRIASAAGVQSLCIPVERSGEARASIGEVRLSPHDNWPRQHWQAIVSAYDSSPYFEYYADDLRPHFDNPSGRLIDFNLGLQQTICRLLDLDVSWSLTTAYEAEPAMDDLRNSFSPKQPAAHDCPEYYQVFRQRHGFLADLSILDLLCNMGPESIFVLTR